MLSGGWIPARPGWADARPLGSGRTARTPFRVMRSRAHPGRRPERRGRGGVQSRRQATGQRRPRRHRAAVASIAIRASLCGALRLRGTTDTARMEPVRLRRAAAEGLRLNADRRGAGRSRQRPDRPAHWAWPCRPVWGARGRRRRRGDHRRRCAGQTPRAAARDLARGAAASVSTTASR
jgi:hypothetical protein